MNIKIDQSPKELVSRLEKLEVTVANLYAQVQSMDSQIFLLETELAELKLAVGESDDRFSSGRG